MGIFAMRTDRTSESISADLKDLGIATTNFANHAFQLGGLGFDTTFLEWVTSFTAIYLLVLDRTNWRTNILTGLLIPYIFLSLSSLIFNILSGQIGKWIAFVVVILRLFFPKHFPEWLDMPAALILLIVVAPSLLSSTIRMASFRNKSIDKWQRKTEVTTGAAVTRGKLQAFNQNISGQVAAYMRDPSRMVKQMQHKRSAVGVFGAGGVDEGENPRNVAIRELREETGVTSAEIIVELITQAEIGHQMTPFMVKEASDWFDKFLK